MHALAVAPEWRPDLFAPLLPGLVAHGVSVVEIPLLRPAELDAEATRKLAAQHDIELVCSLGLPASLNVADRPDEALDFIRVALETTARGGATALSGVTFGVIGQTSGAAPTAHEIDAMVRHVERSAAIAKKLGLRFGIEPCNRYETHLLNTGAAARSVIERSGADNVFIHLDTYHMNIEEVSYSKGFADAGDLLGYVHLSESNRGVPGRGTVDWRDVFAGLKAVGFDGCAALESFVFVDADLASGLAI
ncbi:MAG: sugar phosphate isomerase/epimerase, partial [Alphaproteobacteria bacterium HGW-Alphaproteobacteria-10]